MQSYYLPLFLTNFPEGFTFEILLSYILRVELNAIRICINLCVKRRYPFVISIDFIFLCIQLDATEILFSSVWRGFISLRSFIDTYISRVEDSKEVEELVLLVECNDSKSLLWIQLNDASKTLFCLIFRFKINSHFMRKSKVQENQNR